MSSLPYHEPSITQLLTLSSFLLALNGINALLDRALYCGLVGQVLIGVAWGAPGGNWLSDDLQHAIVQLGYIGLVLLVFEGGAATDVDAVRRNLVLSAGVAVTGVAVPMALGFAVLGALEGASGIQGFAAGAALASTSLGTTFTVLEASGLADTRVGTVLGTAAMMDDVLGLVMVQIVSSLGGVAEGGGEVKIDVGNTVLRPVLVSLGFAVLVPVVCRFGLRPVVMPLMRKVMDGDGTWWRVLGSKQTALVTQTALLLGLVVGASFAGTSVLLAAYLAGIVVSWWADSLCGNDAPLEDPSPRGLDAEPSQEQHEIEPHGEGSEPPRTSEEPTEHTVENNSGASITSSSSANADHQQQSSRHGALEIYETYYSQAVTRILKPFFFASIGFSIPISNMFSGEVVWRGVIYGILMAIGKMMCGLWLVRFPLSANEIIRTLASFASSRYQAVFSRFRHPRKSTPTKNNSASTETSSSNKEVVSPPQNTRRGPTPPSSRISRIQGTATPAKPLSLYPAAIVSCAMVARGEIGFLISAVAESKGVFRRSSDRAEGASELFLIVTWAIVLCTIFGPICVGMLVKRVKKLEAQATKTGGRGTKNVLGAWGVR
ncbi:Sodium/hydrogen exchanger family-domain-containing protein [Daldinia sp. FL1419]|nr:Sodium/hydrogen exchanger family-domain-containing protein [Daldinia sp. FL1419]